jgi:hypothetical protein
MLHIPDDILNAGPMWCYWNYVTERFVGYLVRSSKSRKNPYASFARRLREIAQNNLIKVKYQLHRELDLSDRWEEESRGHTVASCELFVHVRAKFDITTQTPIFVFSTRIPVARLQPQF